MPRNRYLISGLTLAGLATLTAAVLGLASTAGARSEACAKTAWATTAEGAPAALGGKGSGYYVWHNAAGWHLRARAAAGTQLTGSVKASAKIRVARASAAVRPGLTTSARGFGFRLDGTGRLEVVDFTAGCAKSLVFKLGPQTIKLSDTQPSRGAPSNDATASELPVLLGARGKAPATSFELDRPIATGVAGQIVTGPMCPVVNPAHPCPYKPTRGTVRIERAPASRGGAAGEVVATVGSDDQGRFTADLGAGRYVLTVVKDTGGFPMPKPSIASVQAGVVTHVPVLLDTGIR